MTIRADIQKAYAGRLVELFEIDLSPIGIAEQYYFHNGVNELGNDVVFNAITYTRYPIEASGFEKASSGQQPRPVLRAANIDGLLGALARENQDLVRAKVIRRRTFAKYLDAVNFDDGNPEADPNAAFEDEIWFIERKSAENKLFVEWELASALDLEGVQLPRRLCIQNTCMWKTIGGYRGPYCGYAGGAVADKNDAPTTDINLDMCGGRLNSCRLRFGNGELPFGGFPGVGRVGG